MGGGLGTPRDFADEIRERGAVARGEVGVDRVEGIGERAREIDPHDPFPLVRGEERVERARVGDAEVKEKHLADVVPGDTSGELAHPSELGHVDVDVFSLEREHRGRVAALGAPRERAVERPVVGVDGHLGHRVSVLAEVAADGVALLLGVAFEEERVAEELPRARWRELLQNALARFDVREVVADRRVVETLVRVAVVAERVAGKRPVAQHGLRRGIVVDLLAVHEPVDRR